MRPPEHVKLYVHNALQYMNAKFTPTPNTQEHVKEYLRTIRRIDPL